MKKYKIISTLLLISLLESCSYNEFISNINNFINQYIESESSNESISELESESISSIESESTESSSTTNQEINEDRFVNLYSLNDFHGAVNKTTSEPGLENIANYLNIKGKEENTLIVNSGDMFQGSIESNSNYGNLIMDTMNYIHMDAMTLGNHEFDWGIDKIIDNINRDYNGYKTPIITSNLYNYDITTKTILDYASIGPTYTISTLENGLKVGIIGVIGESQITSITSQFVDDFTFIDPTKVIKSISDDLRVNKDVDVIVVLDHDGQSSITGSSNIDNSGITKKSVVSNKRYVDAIICGHTHKNEKKIINGVPFIQTSGYGKQISNIELKVDKDNNVTCITNTNLNPQYEENQDEVLHDLIISYTDKSNEIANEKLATLDGELYSSKTLPNLICKSMYEYCNYQGIDIDYAICNSARYSLYSGTITYGDLFRCIPFDNEVYVIEVSGKEILNEIRYCMMYRNNEEAINENNTYTIATIDYLALHRNESREYDYFSSNKIIDILKDSNNNTINYRDITSWYLKNTKYISSSSFDSKLDEYNTSNLYNNI